MIRRRALVPLLLIPALLAASGPGAVRAEAQAGEWRATVGASVTVAPPPILLETIRDLWFGSVGPGADVIVPARPPYTPGTWSAGARFGNLRKTVTYGMTLTLPAALVSGSGATLPVSWSGSQYGWICVWNTSSGTPGACTVMDAAFDPSAHTASGTPLLVDFPNNVPQNNVFAADVYVGGRLTIPNQPLAPGLYSAPLRITLAAIN